MRQDHFWVEFSGQLGEAVTSGLADWLTVGLSTASVVADRGLYVSGEKIFARVATDIHPDSLSLKLDPLG